MSWRWYKTTEPVWRDFVYKQHEVYMRIAIVRGLDFHQTFRTEDKNPQTLRNLVEKFLGRIQKNQRTMGEDWDLDFPDLEALRKGENELW